MRKRVFVIGLAVAMMVAAALPAAADNGKGHARTLTYEVTVYNLTDTQWFTPPLVATHSRRADLFEPGHPASAGIRDIAENGNLDTQLAALEGVRAISDVVVAVASDELPPLGPGAAVTFEITSTSRARLLSAVSMLICTNDGFAAIDSVKLPRGHGRTASAYGYSWDAGTEINTEDFADMVPPCQALNGVSSDDDGTGASNPALAENGVISPHQGIGGGNDLTDAAHGWDTKAPAVKISVTRTG